jgi:adenine-specific DNA-methyltransferase
VGRARSSGGRRRGRTAAKTPTPVEAIEHQDSRTNIPTEQLREFAPPEQDRQLRYPRDPSLDPQLVWRGKDELDEDALAVWLRPIFIQEKVDPRALIEDLRRQSDGRAPRAEQLGLFDNFNGFESFEEKVSTYYHHDAPGMHWSNRMILGDSLMVMASLAEKEGLRGKVQTIYLDPPYGIKFGSNWQVSTRKRDVRDGRAEDVTRQPEMVRAFRDTWQLGIHSYLTYLRDRFVVARDLLAESGSIFVQIGRENVHLIRNILDEVFGSENFLSVITFAKTSGQTDRLLASVSDYIVWYAKARGAVKYRQPLLLKDPTGQGGSAYRRVLEDDQSRTAERQELVDPESLPERAHLYRLDNLTSQSPGTRYEVDFKGRKYEPVGYWKTDQDRFPRLIRAGRVEATGRDNLYYRRRFDDFLAFPVNDTWTDTVIAGFASDKRYVVETSAKVIERCLLMTTDPGDLVFDPTCGSGHHRLRGRAVGPALDHRRHLARRAHPRAHAADVGALPLLPARGQ